MNVSTNYNVATATANTTTSSDADVDYQSFLKLLVAEMQNQDPTDPMESSEYIAQLASFSEVEQSIQTNSKLDDILQANALAQASDLVGRTVTSEDGSVSGKVASVKLYIDGVSAILESGEEIAMLAGVQIS